MDQKKSVRGEKVTSLKLSEVHELQRRARASMERAREPEVPSPRGSSDRDVAAPQFARPKVAGEGAGASGL